MRYDLIKSRPDVVKGWLQAEIEAQQFAAGSQFGRTRCQETLPIKCGLPLSGGTHREVGAECGRNMVRYIRGLVA